MSSNGANVPEASAGSESVRSNSNLSTYSEDAASTRFRHRKISVKQRLRIYLPSDLKNLDKNEIQKRELGDVETGVEKNEEKEVHLHRILQKGSEQLDDTKKDYIPTPDASKIWDEFNKFYYGKVNETQSYIKFSATVEDCCGVGYTLDAVDSEYLENVFNKDATNTEDKISEDEFETLCTAFETAIHERQPFLQMDPETILTFEEVKPTLLKVDFNDLHIRTKLSKDINEPKGSPLVTEFDAPGLTSVRPIELLIEKFGKKIYEHWCKRKIDAKGAEIFPQLKFERPGEKEEVDPYVCFRRRELRHPRKTRRIDILNSQKLRVLLKELQHTKDMSILVAKREQAHLNIIKDDLNILDKRKNIINLKRQLDIKGEDEDLINHKRKRPMIITLEKRRQEAEALAAAKRAQEEELAASMAKAAEAKAKSKSSKKQAEQLSKTKNAKQKNASSQDLTKKNSGTNIKQEEEQPQQQPILSHVYVKLPSSKIPDIVLEDVEKLLINKEKSARKFVQERMAKRKLEDNNEFFNLTDTPQNPVFDITMPYINGNSVSPFSSIASAKFTVDKSYYLKNLDVYREGKSDDISVINKDGDKLEPEDTKSAQSLQKLKQIETYNPYDCMSEIHSREFPLQFRRRFGRGNIEYLDVKKPQSHMNYSGLEEFLNLDEICDQEFSTEKKYIDVYDSKFDEFSRLNDRWKYDSPSNEYGLRFADEPARLNQISNATQIIRFGTMLGTKSYEQLKEATIRYRKEYIAKLRQQKLNAQKQQQLFQQQQQMMMQQQQQQNQQQSPQHQQMSPQQIVPQQISQQLQQQQQIAQQQMPQQNINGAPMVTNTGLNHIPDSKEISLSNPPGNNMNQKV